MRKGGNGMIVSITHYEVYLLILYWSWVYICWSIKRNICFYTYKLGYENTGKDSGPLRMDSGLGKKFFRALQQGRTG
jgi:hypothetical protein